MGITNVFRKNPLKGLSKKYSTLFIFLLGLATAMAQDAEVKPGGETNHHATVTEAAPSPLADRAHKEKKSEQIKASSAENFQNEIEEFCGELKAFTGELEILDSARTQILSTHVGVEIPCGAWITVLSGWAELAHRDGYEVRAGESTFFSWVDPVPGDHRFQKSEKRISLFRGSLLVKAEKGGPSVRVDSPSAVARIKAGRAVVIYDEAAEETQVVGVHGKSSLENRYVQESAVSVGPGELTRLGLKEKRVVPTPGAAIATAPLRPLIMGFGLIGQEKMEVLTALESRRKTMFPSMPHLKQLKNRAIANLDHRDQKRYVQTSPEDFEGLPEFGASGVVDRTHFKNTKHASGKARRELASAKSESTKKFKNGPSAEQIQSKERARLLREIRSLRPE